MHPVVVAGQWQHENHDVIFAHPDPSELHILGDKPQGVDHAAGPEAFREEFLDITRIGHEARLQLRGLP